MTGRTIAHRRILDKLGEGAMGVARVAVRDASRTQYGLLGTGTAAFPLTENARQCSVHSGGYQLAERGLHAQVRTPKGPRDVLEAKYGSDRKHSPCGSRWHASKRGRISTKRSLQGKSDSHRRCGARRSNPYIVASLGVDHSPASAFKAARRKQTPLESLCGS
jgi:hypothetical protein